MIVYIGNQRKFNYKSDEPRDCEYSRNQLADLNIFNKAMCRTYPLTTDIYFSTIHFESTS